MSRLALVILLLQRLGVIDIVLLLIYSFYRKTPENLLGRGGLVLKILALPYNNRHRMTSSKNKLNLQR
jgi:hypothetical protein